MVDEEAPPAGARGSLAVRCRSLPCRSLPRVIPLRTVLGLLSEALRSQWFDAWVRDAVTAAQREHDRRREQNEELAGLEKDVQRQEATVTTEVFQTTSSSTSM